MDIKVLHITGRASYDGTCIYAVRLIQHTQEFNSTLLCIRKGGAENEIKKNIKKSIILSKKNSENNMYLILLLLKTVFFLLKNRFDIIHFHSGGKSFLLTSYFLRRKAKFIHHLHCGNISCNSTRFKLNILEKFIYKFLKNRTIQIAVAEHVAEYYRKYVGKSSNLHTILNSVPFNFIPGKPLTNSIGFIGQISNSKNFDKVLNIFMTIKLVGMDLNLKVKGDIYDEELIKSCTFQNKISVENPSLSISGFYENIDILLFLSEAPYEGCPLVILEALNFNVAIIAINTVAVNEILGNYPLSVEAFNIKNISGEINNFYSDESIRNNLTSTHNNILAKYNFENHLTKIKSLYINS